MSELAPERFAAAPRARDLLYGALVLGVFLLTFALDSRDTHGLACWTFYSLGMAAALFWGGRRGVVAAAVTAILLTIAGGWLSPSTNSTPQIINRALGIMTLGLVAALCLSIERRSVAVRRLRASIIEAERRREAELLRVREERLRAEEARCRLLLDSASEGVYAVDRDGRCTFINAAGARMLGYSAEDLLGGPLHELIHHSRPDGTPHPKFECPISEVLKTGRACRAEDEVFWRRDGTPVPVGYGASPILERGLTSGVAVTFSDLTEEKERERELREGQEQWQRLFAESRHSMFIFDLDTLSILAVNDAAVRHYGYSHAEFLGMTLEDIRPSDDVPALLEMVAQERARPLPAAPLGPKPGRHRRKDGGYIDVEVTVHPLARGGRPTRLAVVSDVTERKRAERALLESEERFRQLAEHIDEVFWLGATDATELFYVSPAYERVWGRLREGVYASPLSWLDAVHAADRDRVRQALVKLASGEYDEQFRVIRPDGSIRWVRARAFPVPDRTGEIYRVAGIAEDITERVRVEDELRSLATALFTAQENERSRLSRELHDEANQSLALLELELDALLGRPVAAVDPIREQLQGLKAKVAELSEHLGRLAYQLHPAVLDDLGLPVALRAYVEEFIRREGIPVDIVLKDVPESIPPDVSLCLYRVVQECLRNIAKHASATEVKIALEGSGDAIQLAVKDSGTGFDLSLVKQRGHGLGLIAMPERVRLLKGTFSIHSEPGKGTRVSVRVPLPGRSS